MTFQTVSCKKNVELQSDEPGQMVYVPELTMLGYACQARSGSFQPWSSRPLIIQTTARVYTKPLNLHSEIPSPMCHEVKSPPRKLLWRSLSDRQLLRVSQLLLDREGLPQEHVRFSFSELLDSSCVSFNQQYLLFFGTHRVLCVL